MVHEDAEVVTWRLNVHIYVNSAKSPSLSHAPVTRKAVS